MTETEVKNAANEKIQRDRNLSYSKTFSKPLGKKVLEDLEKFCGFNDSSVCEQAPDALQTMYNEGKRRVYLRIKSLILKGKENE